MAKTLINGRAGFTLIELLIVIVIVGILAAVALPKFSRVRERAHFKTMITDLRNLAAVQEIYFGTPANNYSYASSTTDFGPGYGNSQGVIVEITAAGASGWAATASHQSMAANQTCAMFVGSVTTIPSPATAPGEVACTGE